MLGIVSLLLDLLFGFHVLHRTFLVFSEMKLLKYDFKNFALAVGFFCVLLFLFRGHDFVIWAFLLAFSFVPAAILLFIEKLRKSHFESHIISFLDQILLSMKSGRSFRESVLVVGSSFTGPSEFYFRELLGALVHISSPNISLRTQVQVQPLTPTSWSSPPPSPPVWPRYREVYTEFQRVVELNHKSIERLEALRRKIKVEEDFRRKTDRVLVQIRAQAGVLGFLYLGLLIFVMINYQLSKILLLVGLSILFFLLGLVCMLWVVRSFQWKV